MRVNTVAQAIFTVRFIAFHFNTDAAAGCLFVFYFQGLFGFNSKVELCKKKNIVCGTSLRTIVVPRIDVVD